MNLFPKVIVMTAVLLCVSGMLFASTGDTFELDELENTITRIRNFFTSNIMKGILGIVLGGLIVGVAVNRENPEQKKRFLVFVIAVGALLSLSQIMDTIFTNGALLV